MIDLNKIGAKRGNRKNHKKGIAAQALDRKRVEAKLRQDEYDKLTVTQKIAKLDAGGYNATKQRTKLMSVSKSNSL